MNDKWSQRRVEPTKKEIKDYSEFPYKAWSFGLCFLVFFSLVFNGNDGFELGVAVFMAFITGINMLVKAKNAVIQAYIVFIGFSVSIFLIIYHCCPINLI